MKGGGHNFKEAQTTIQFLLGPIKIKDGLFMGDQFAAKVFVDLPRTSNLSLAIKLHISSIPYPKIYLIYTNDLEFNTFQSIGLKKKKMYQG